MYKDKGLVVLGVNQSDARKIALDYLEQNGVDFPNILDDSRAAMTALQAYETLEGMTAVPMTYVIDREGKVVDAWYGFEKARMEAVVEKLGL